MIVMSSQTFVPYMFWITVLDAFYQSLVCFFVPYFVSTPCKWLLITFLLFTCTSVCLSSPHVVRFSCESVLGDFFLFSQAYAGSDVGVLSFGSPINASALFIILLHQVIESNTLVRLTTTTQNHLYFSWAVSQLLCLYNNKCVA